MPRLAADEFNAADNTTFGVTLVGWFGFWLISVNLLQPEAIAAAVKSNIVIFFMILVFKIKQITLKC